MGGAFLRIECPECGHKQQIYTKPSMKVTCNSCGAVVAEPSGGIGEFKGRLLK